jgi:hypothetical protein
MVFNPLTTGFCANGKKYTLLFDKYLPNHLTRQRNLFTLIARRKAFFFKKKVSDGGVKTRSDLQRQSFVLKHSVLH